MIRDLVSIIIPVYNDCRFLDQAINSVLKQTYSQFEIIIVDDGSSNSTEISAIAESVNSKKLKYIRNPKNVGLAASRNVGIKESKGEFICFLDADDILREEKLEVQVELLENHGEWPMVFSDEYAIKNAEKVESPQQFPAGYEPEHPIINRFVQSSFIAVFTVLVRREILDQVGLFNESLRWNEDDDLWFRIMLKSDPGYSHYVSGYRRLHDQNMSLDRTRMNFFQIKTFSNWVNYCKQAGRTDLKKIIKDRALNIAKTYFKTTLRRGKIDTRAFGYYLNILSA